MLLPTQFIFIKRYRGKKPTKHELLTEGKTADDRIWVWEPVIGAQGMQHFKKRTQTYWDKNWTKFWEGFYHSESIFPQQTEPNQSWGNEFNNLNNINNIFYYYHFFIEYFVSEAYWFVLFAAVVRHRPVQKLGVVRIRFQCLTEKCS